MMLVALVSATFGYIIREKDGFLAVWDCNSEQWGYVSDTPVSALPEHDRRAVENGIAASSVADLSAMLEDYCS